MNVFQQTLAEMKEASFRFLVFLLKKKEKKREKKPFQSSKPTIVKLMNLFTFHYIPLCYISPQTISRHYFHRQWTSKIPRACAVRYNPYTQCIETMSTREQLVKMIADTKNDMDVILHAFKCIS